MRTDKIALLTDSCADIPVEVARKNHIYVVPFTITFEEGSYQDGVDIFPDDVYRRQPNEVIKTSLPSGAVIEDTLHKIKEDGYEKVIAIMLSSGLSGGYQIVRMLGEEEEALEVAVFDSMSGSLGEGAMVLTVARWIEEGRTWETMLACIPRMMKQVYPYFSVDTLEYLKRGGRIGKITAMAGTALGIKPILAFDPVSGELTEHTQSARQTGGHEKTGAGCRVQAGAQQALQHHVGTRRHAGGRRTDCRDAARSGAGFPAGVFRTD